MGQSGIERVCPSCQHVYSKTEPAKQNAAPAEPAPAHKKSRKKPESFDVIKEAKRRRSHVAKEVKRLTKELKAAEKELGQLTRLLDAAEPPPANVRRLKTATS